MTTVTLHQVEIIEWEDIDGTQHITIEEMEVENIRANGTTETGEIVYYPGRWLVERPAGTEAWQVVEDIA